MTVRPFKANVGRQQYRGRMALTSQADFGNQIRTQMAAIMDNFKQWVENVDGQTAQIVYDALEPTFEKSQGGVPVDTGELKDSGYLEMRQSRGRGQVEIGYARGGNPDYAVVVHEDLFMRHQAPTTAKFLQGPLEEDANDIRERILEGIRVASGFAT